MSFTLRRTWPRPMPAVSAADPSMVKEITGRSPIASTYELEAVLYKVERNSFPEEKMAPSMGVVTRDL